MQKTTCLQQDRLRVNSIPLACAALMKALQKKLLQSFEGLLRYQLGAHSAMLCMCSARIRPAGTINVAFSAYPWNA